MSIWRCRCCLVKGEALKVQITKNRKKKRIIKVFLLLMVCMFFISYMRTNVFDIIGKRKIAVLIRIPEVDENSDIWEWNQELDFFRFNSVIYDKEYLREEISDLRLNFGASNNDVGIFTEVWLSKKDLLGMVLYANYSYEAKELEYTQVGISHREGENYEIYMDPECVNQYLDQYNITKEDISEYYRYVIYDVILKTWTDRYRRIYGLEKWKLEQCRLIDNDYQFKERKE